MQENNNEIQKPSNTIKKLLISLPFLVLFIAVVWLIYSSYRQNSEIRKTTNELSNLGESYQKKLENMDEKINSLVGVVNKLTDDVVSSQMESEEKREELKQLREELNRIANLPTPTPNVLLSVVSIDPISIPKNYESKKINKLTILGKGFEQNTEIQVISSDGSLPYGGGTTTYISSTKLEFQLPSYLNSGYYDLLFKNSDSSQYLNKGSFLVTSQEL